MSAPSDEEQARKPRSAGSALGRVVWMASSCYPLLFTAALHLEWFYLWDMYGMRPDRLHLFTPFDHGWGPAIHATTEFLIAATGPIATLLVLVLMIGVARRAAWVRTSTLIITLAIWCGTVVATLMDPFGAVAWRLG